MEWNGMSSNRKTPSPEVLKGPLTYFMHPFCFFFFLRAKNRFKGIALFFSATFITVYSTYKRLTAGRIHMATASFAP